MSVADSRHSGLPEVRPGEAGGLHVLVVSSYDETSSSSRGNKAFHDLVRSLVGPNARIVKRKLDELGDYIISFEYDILTEASKSIARRFDKVDLVFLSGDVREMPWSPRAAQLVTFLRMCNVCKKAVLSCGAMALHSVFNLATQGRRLHLLNPPHGDALARLAAFPRYAASTRKHLCGWLDNDTGDVYEYDAAVCMWRPLVNVGFYRLAQAGPTGDDRVRPPSVVHGRDLRATALPSAAVGVEALGGGEEVVQVRNLALQHHAMRKMPGPKFVLSVPPGWYFNSDGALPTGPGGEGGEGMLTVLAEGRRGPVLFSYDCCVLLGAEVEAAGSMSHRLLRRLMKNFVRRSADMLRDGAAGINQSLLELLFGPRGEGGGVGIFSPGAMAAPLAASSISSALGKGPTRVPAPVDVPHAPAPAARAEPHPDDVDNEALTSPRQHYSTGKKIRVTSRHPSSARQRRMDLFLTSQGHTELQSISKAALQASQQKGRERGLYNLASNGESPVPELGLDRLQLGSAEEHGHQAPNSSRHLFGDHLAYLDGRRKVDFKQEEAALLLGNAGGLEYRPGMHRDNRRKLTDPLDPGLLHKARPKSAGPTHARAPAPSAPSVPALPAAHAAAGAPAPALQDEPTSWLGAMIQKDLYDVYINAPPRAGSRARPHTASVGHRDAYSALSSSMKDEHLPPRHPVPPPARIAEPPTSPVKSKKPTKKPAAAPVDGDGSLAGSSLASSLGRPSAQVQSFAPIKKVIIIPGQEAARPHNTYKKFVRMGEVDPQIGQDGDYLGKYTEVYRTPLETEIHAYNQSKKSFLAGPFKTHFGVASQIPLRQEGQIRPNGAYPDSAPLGVPAWAVAQDWTMVPAEDRERRVGGEWRK